MPKINILSFSVTLFLFAGLISGCSGVQPTQILLTPTQPVIPTSESADTPTPVANIIWFIAGNNLPGEQTQQILQTVQDQAQNTGWQLEQKESLSKDELAAEADRIKVIVVSPPDPGLADLASAYPEIAFITIGISGLTEAANLYQVAPQGIHPEWEGYLAGYIAAIVTDDWRIGMLTQAGSADGASAASGFYNGGVMYCGLCNPEFPPYTDYPYVMEINAGLGQAEWQPLADSFIQKQIKTAYVYPSIATNELMLYLAQNNVRLISSTLPPEGLQSAWIAVIQTDYNSPFQSAWADLRAGIPGSRYPVKIQLTPVDTSLLTDGKIKWINQVIDDLIYGTLMP